MLTAMTAALALCILSFSGPMWFIFMRPTAWLERNRIRGYVTQPMQVDVGEAWAAMR
ncbi:unnamed protein product [Symbiodinium natans]|uniref:Uncharacterized protein n=1 Tax=Symbiodinium natans TaxID=878477 RepID=A0A812N1V3_9DINO|nr:unnamed protein product [Symbiodinium natans]